MKFQDLTTLLEQDESIFKPRRIQDRDERYENLIQQRIQEYIKGGSIDHLVLAHQNIKSLPDNLKKVGGWLMLSYSQVKSLPEGLHVVGTLVLSDTQIESLPKGLKVGGAVYLDHSLIKTLPEDIRVGGNVVADNTPLSQIYNVKQLRRMCPGIKGKIYL